MALKSLGPSPGLVIALDIADFAKTLDVVKETSQVEGVRGYKIGLTSVIPLGLPEVVRQLRQVTQKFILYDHQKAGPDMPDMAPLYSALCREAGADGLVLFPTAGPTAVKEFTQHAINQQLTPFVGGQIPVPDYSTAGGGFLADDALDRIVEIAADAGAEHFIFPANDLKGNERRSHMLLDRVANPTVILTGIGPLGGTVEASFHATRSVSNKYAIVGRSVTASSSPRDAAERLCAEMIEHSTVA